MHASLFYTVEHQEAIHLLFVTKAQWNEGLSELTIVERNQLATQQFHGNLGELCLLTNAQGLLSKVYLGLGDESNDAQQALAVAATALPPGCYQLQQAVASMVYVTWGLAQYRFSEYKKSTAIPKVLVVPPKQFDAVLMECQAIFLVRDLINKPSNDLGPAELASQLANLAKTYQAEFKQWVGEELESANFPAIHAVGRASAKAPRLLSLTWGNPKHPRIALVGKGVCFDSGGLDLKPASAMRLMKKDMAGAAHVVGLAQWLMAAKVPIYLEVLIPAVENAVGPNAFRPGDIIKMRNGLTVEIDNTDGEGRLILADALVKAVEGNPELIIDFSTLTGAARVAVGTEIAAMFCNDEVLATALLASALATSDPLWRLPLFAGYESMLDSAVADLVNTSPSPYAGAITAALFIQRFIPKGLPWVHFDSMAWNLSSKPGKPEGGEAMAMRAVADYLFKRFSP